MKNILLKILFISTILVVGCGTSKSIQTKTIKYLRPLIVKNNNEYKITNLNPEFKEKIKTINKIIDNKIKEVGGKEKIRLASLSSDITNLLYSMGIDFKAVSASVSLDPTIKSIRQSWNKYGYNCPAIKGIFFKPSGTKTEGQKLEKNGCYVFSEKTKLYKIRNDIVPQKTKIFGDMKGKKIYNLGFFKSPNSEIMKEAKINFIVTPNWGWPSVTKALKPFEKLIYYISGNNLADYFVALETFGNKLGNKTKVNQIWEKMYNVQDKILKKLDKKQPLKKAMVIRAEYDSVSTAGNSGIPGSLAKYLNFKLITVQPPKGKGSFSGTKEEVIVDVDPDYIIMSTHPSLSFASLKKQMSQKEWFTKLSAYKNNQIIYVNDLVNIKKSFPDIIIKLSKVL